MDALKFRAALLAYINDFQSSVADSSGDWIVKGFIDIYRNIYTISIDTKVVSKIVELLLFPLISQFSKDHGLTMVLAQHQNHYPDVSFVADNDTKFALDVKSTYRTSAATVNGFTLGAFTGYFRNRVSTKNITFPYQDYDAHLVLGVIYSRNTAVDEERRRYRLDQLQEIASVVTNFQFLVQEKWRIASDQPGSGNTKNVGSVSDTQKLIEGAGPFSRFSEQVFDDYWKNYLTGDMARAIDSVIPYRNLQEYFKWRNVPAPSQPAQ